MIVFPLNERPQVLARFMLDFAPLFPRQELERYNAEMAAFEVPRASVKLVIEK
jgi:hypothetical protein